MEIYLGTTEKSFKNNKTNKREKRTSIIDIVFNEEYNIFIFNGTLSDNDFIVTYSQTGKNVRTPKHIHWAVDLLLKMQADEMLTREFIKELKNEWKTCEPLENCNEATLTTLVGDYVQITDISKYKGLSDYGEYDIEFLRILMMLLMVQEKTNYSGAYMFGNVLDALLEERLDIFHIMSTTGFRGGA